MIQWVETSYKPSTHVISFCHQPEDAQLTFDLHPPTAITLQLATYYYALQFYRLLVSEGGSPCPSSIFNQDPNEVTQRILNHIKVSFSGCISVSDMPRRVTYCCFNFCVIGTYQWCGSDSKTSRWPPGASHLAKLLLHYNEKLIDLTEAKLLKDLDHGQFLAAPFASSATCNLPLSAFIRL